MPGGLPHALAHPGCMVIVSDWPGEISLEMLGGCSVIFVRRVDTVKNSGCVRP